MPEAHIRARVLKALAKPALADEIARAVITPLTETELRGALDRMFGPNLVWIGVYSELPVFGEETLRAWLQSIPAQAAVILYRWEKTYGHWNALFMGKHNTIQFFDSLANSPDTMQKKQTEREADMLGQGDRRLVHALHHRPAYYNDAMLQQPTAQVCGRWVLLRLALRNLDADEFIAFIASLVRETGQTADVVVAAATI